MINVIDMTIDAAREILSNLELSASISYQYSSDVPEDMIMAQSVGAGETVSAGDTVRLVVSAGEENILVVENNNDLEDNNTVEQISESSEENLTEEIELEPNKILVPNFTGLSLDDASDLAVRTDLSVSFVYEYHDSVHEGLFASKYHAKGSSIDLIYIIYLGIC